MTDITKETLSAMGLDLSKYSAEDVRKEAAVRDTNAQAALDKYRESRGIQIVKAEK